MESYIGSKKLQIGYFSSPVPSREWHSLFAPSGVFASLTTSIGVTYWSTMVSPSSIPKKTNKIGFASWFVPGNEEEKDDTRQAAHTPQHPDDTSGPQGSVDRRRSCVDEARPKSAIAITQANKPRVRTIPLKRTASSGSEPSGPFGLGHLIRMSSKNETAIMILPGKKREPQQDNQVDNDVHSTQSSITNSWVPRLKLYHPAPYAPHKPIENMVISIQKPGSECSSREEAGKGGDDNTNSTARSSSHSGPPDPSVGMEPNCCTVLWKQTNRTPRIS